MRYYLVSVPDDEANYCRDSMDELKQVHGATVTEAHMLGEGTQNYVFTAPKPGA